jgi:hypothetical protein
MTKNAHGLLPAGASSTPSAETVYTLNDALWTETTYTDRPNLAVRLAPQPRAILQIASFGTVQHQLLIKTIRSLTSLERAKGIEHLALFDSAPHQEQRARSQREKG